MAHESSRQLYGNSLALGCKLYFYERIAVFSFSLIIFLFVLIFWPINGFRMALSATEALVKKKVYEKPQSTYKTLTCIYIHNYNATREKNAKKPKEKKKGKVKRTV